MKSRDTFETIAHDNCKTYLYIAGFKAQGQ